jgi:sulfite oxidase
MTSQAEDTEVNGKTSPKVDGMNGNAPTNGESEIEILHPSLTLRTKEVPDPEALGLTEELAGWHGYVEWEKYPERKKEVKEYMKKFDFPGVSLSPG